MAHAAARTQSMGGLALPALLLLALLTLIVLQVGIPEFAWRSVGVQAPQTVRIEPRPFTYRASGDYLRAGVPVDGSLVSVAAPAPLEIMKFEVSALDYKRCIADRACQASESRRSGAGDVPVTGVSFNDAEDYAAWLSAATGEAWRLPTIEEWAFAAGSQAVDDALFRETDAGNPAERWLALYEKETVLGIGNASARVQPLGAFGENEFGVADLTGTVWEWTATCNGRTSLDAGGAVLSVVESCGVRLLEGNHRTPMSAFIRDGRSGGCAVGAPPDNLGFRLVRETAWYAPLWRMLSGLPVKTGNG